MEPQQSQRVRRTQRDYSFPFKMMVVHEVEKGQLTYKQAQEKYGIQGRTTVLTWLRKHGQQDWTSITMPKLCKRQLTPQQRIRQLEKQLAEEKLKTEFVEDVICHPILGDRRLYSADQRLQVIQKHESRECCAGPGYGHEDTNTTSF